MRMRNIRPAHLVCLVIFQVTSCFAHHMAVVVNKNNPITDIPSTHLAKIVRADARKWPNGTDISLVLHRASKGEMSMLQKLSKVPEKTLKVRLEAHPADVIEVNSDTEVMGVVESTPGAIGFVEVRSVNSKVKVIKVDGKLPMEGGYLPD